MVLAGIGKIDNNHCKIECLMCIYKTGPRPTSKRLDVEQFYLLKIALNETEKNVMHAITCKYIITC